MPVVGGVGRINVGLVAPCLRQGGAEHWMLDLIDGVNENPSRYRINWQGLAVLDDPANASSDMEMAMLSKVGFVNYGEVGLYRLANVCDVLISWAVYPFHSMLDQIAKLPPIIFVTLRSDEPWSITTQNWLAFVSAVVVHTVDANANVPPQFASITTGMSHWVNENHFPTASTRASIRATWTIPTNAAKVVGYLGRFDPERRPMLMVEVAKLLPANWYVLLVGEGVLYNQLFQAITAPGSQGNLKVPGPTDDVGGFFLAVDWLVSPTSRESWGKSVAEAWYQGVPTISTPYGVSLQSPAHTRTLPSNPSAADIVTALMADFNDPTGTANRAATAQSFARNVFSSRGGGSSWSRFLDTFYRP